MLSTFPANFASKKIFSDQFPSFSPEFPPWDCSELITIMQSPNTISSSSPPLEESPTQWQSMDSVVDERKHKRKISNRESARRSRVRKQKHLDNLINQVNRLRNENHELTSRLQYMYMMSYCHQVMSKNEQLRYEQSVLRERLTELRQVLVVKEMMHEQFTSTTTVSSWPCNSAIVANNTTTTSEQIPSLITY